MLPFVIIKSGILSVLLESPEGSSSSKVITLTSWALERLADQLGLRPPEALNLENLSKNAQVTGLVTAELPVKAAEADQESKQPVNPRGICGRCA